MPVYHESAQKTDTSNGAEENTGEPTNDTPEQETDVPPDSRVAKRDAVYRSLTLGDSVVQRKRLAMGHKPDDHEEISYT